MANIFDWLLGSPESKKKDPVRERAEKRLNDVGNSFFNLSNFGSVRAVHKMAHERERHDFSNKDVDGKIFSYYHVLMNPSGIISSINDEGGFLSPCRYLVAIDPPPVMQKYKAGFFQTAGYAATAYSELKIGLLCNSVSIPQKMLNTYEHKQLGVPYKVPHSLVFDPTVMTFYADARCETRRFFDMWIKAIINDQNAAMNFYDEYTSSIDINLLDRQGNVRYIIRLHEAYPINISNVDLAYGSTNTVLTASVTMTYRRWEEIPFK